MEIGKPWKPSLVGIAETFLYGGEKPWGKIESLFVCGNKVKNAVKQEEEEVNLFAAEHANLSIGF